MRTVPGLAPSFFLLGFFRPAMGGFLEIGQAAG